MTPGKKPSKPLDIYVRVSQTAGRDVDAPGGTASEQEKACRAYIESQKHKGLTWSGLVFTDLDVSGGKTSRPQFDIAKARIASGESGGMCFLNLSRFGRNRNVAGDIIELVDLGGTIISVEDAIDTSSNSGKLMIDIMSAFNVYYLANVTDGWKKTHTNMIERGVPSGPTPVGYKKPPAIGKYAQSLVLDGDPEDPSTPAGCIRVGYEMRARGESFVKIALLFTHAGLRTFRGNTLWTDDAARSVIENEAYMGWARHGKRINKKAHDPIVDAALWRRAQAVTKQSKLRGSKQDGPASLLAKLLTCPGCGGHLTRNEDGRGYQNYVCLNGRCPGGSSIKAEAVEGYVIRAVLSYVSMSMETVEGNPTTDTAELEQAVEEAYAECVQFAEMQDITVEELSPNSRQVKTWEAAESALQQARGANLQITETKLGPVATFLTFRDSFSLADKRNDIATVTKSITVARGRGSVADRVQIVFANGRVYVPGDSKIERVVDRLDITPDPGLERVA